MKINQPGPRFDDIVRTERYFSATLLPAILFHDGCTGLRQFVELLDARATTERDANGNQTPKRNLTKPEESDQAVSFEIITEFHITRDLDNAGFHLDPAVKEEHLDVPDLVLIRNNFLIVCEAKFFNSVNLTTLNQQLVSQRQQIAHLLEARPQLTAYIQVALLPQVPGGQVDCDVVVTWDEVASLSARVLGRDHYVTQRFQNAVVRRTKSSGGSESLNYNGIETLGEVISRFVEHGNGVEIGHLGGQASLSKQTPDYVRQRPWKWRDPKTNQGKTDRRNWIRGATFIRVIADVISTSGLT